MAPKYSTADYVFQFITVFAGVLLAILANTAVEWNNNKQLVAAARNNITLELTANKKDLAGTMSGFDRDQKNIENAIDLANDLLKAGKSKINSFNLNYNLADLSASAWHTAERTGALSHMDYGEVQKYSKVYDMQELFIQQQRGTLTQLSSATSIMFNGFDMDHLTKADLETFRERLMTLGGMINITGDLAKNLAKAYEEALK